MTEKDWLNCTDPTPMLEFLQGKVSDRKMRLFAVACCRRIWHLLTDERSRRAVDAAERFADGGGAAEVNLASEEAARATNESPNSSLAAAAAERIGRFCSDREVLLCEDVRWFTAKAAASVRVPEANEPAFMAEEEAIQRSLLCDIFGPLPFRAIAFDPAWRTSTVLALAHTVYDERAFEQMPILGDALEDAGCTNTDLLSHSRGTGPHVRGCWALDLLLGRR